MVELQYIFPAAITRQTVNIKVVNIVEHLAIKPPNYTSKLVETKTELKAKLILDYWVARNMTPETNKHKSGSISGQIKCTFLNICKHPRMEYFNDCS